jgi:8-oxo-dGTP diphosphatase
MTRTASGKLVSVRTLVLRDEQVLLVGHRSTKTNQVWWMTPGGLVDDGESAVDAAAREVEEETGLEVQIGRLVCWAEWIWQRSHCVELMFLGEVTGGQLAAGNDPELPEDQQIIFDARFFDLDDLDEHPVYPPVLATLLSKHRDQGLPEGAVYLGTHEPDLPR